MTRQNNFNTNSDGKDIEFYCSYDNDLSRIYFEESIKIIKHSSYQQSCLAVYIDSGNIDDDFTLVLKGKKADMLNYVLEYNNSGADSSWSKEELHDEILNNIDDIYNIEWEIETLNNHKLTLRYKNDIRAIETRGYSQGDYAKVLCDFTQLKKAWGKTPIEADIKKYIDRLFWDSPIACCFTIDGDEYNYGELMPDFYEWDSDEFIKLVAEKSGADIKELESFMPQYPSYN